MAHAKSATRLLICSPSAGDWAVLPHRPAACRKAGKPASFASALLCGLPLTTGLTVAKRRRDVNVRADIDAWFAREILPLEAALTQYLRRNGRDSADLVDLPQDIYLRIYETASKEFPKSSKPNSTKSLAQLSVLSALGNLSSTFTRGHGVGRVPFPGKKPDPPRDWE